MALDGRFDQIRTHQIISTGSNGTNAKVLMYDQIVSTNLSGGFSPTLFTTTAIGTDVFLYVSGNIGSTNGTDGTVSVFGGDLVVSGTARFFTGLSGSLQTLTNGTSYLVAGPNITITTQSNGSIAITGSAGGGTSIFTNSGVFAYTTSSVALGVSSYFTSGSDVFFYVSGASGSIGNTTLRGVALFGGDIVVSGGLWARSGLIFPYNAGTQYITLTGSGATEQLNIFKLDASNNFVFGSSNGTYNGTTYLVGPANSQAIIIQHGDSNVSNNDIVISSDAGVSFGTQTDPGANNLGLKNNTFLKGKNSGGTYRNLVGLDNNNNVLVADINQQTALVGGGINLNSSTTFPTTGSDTFLYVSGAIGSVGTSTRGAAVFGGDMQVSGNLNVALSATVGTLTASQASTFTSALFVGSLLTANSGLVVNGASQFNGKIIATGNQISGSLQVLADGVTPYLIGGPNITITTQSNGAVAISGSAGSSLFTQSASFAYTTSSVVIGSGTYATTIGKDVFFYVSGNANVSRPTTQRGVAVFEGDVVISGGLLCFGQNFNGVSSSLWYLNVGNNLVVQNELLVEGPVLLYSNPCSITGSDNGLSPVNLIGMDVNNNITIGQTFGPGNSPYNMNLSASQFVFGQANKAYLGTECYMYFSGAINGLSGIPNKTATIFGGDVAVSGGMKVFNPVIIQNVSASLTTTASLFSLNPSGVLGIPYNAQIMARNSTDTTWLNIAAYSNGSAVVKPNTLILGDGLNSAGVALSSNLQVLAVFTGSAGTSYIGNSVPALTDTILFLSGATGTEGTANRGVTLIGGDFVVSGSSHALGTFKVEGTTIFNGVVNTQSTLFINQPVYSYNITDFSAATTVRSNNNVFSGSTFVSSSLITSSFTATIGISTYNLSCSTAVTCTLPAAQKDARFEFWDVSGSLATLPCLFVPSGSQLINGQSSYLFNRNWGGQSFSCFSGSTGFMWIAGQ